MGADIEKKKRKKDKKEKKEKHKRQKISEPEREAHQKKLQQWQKVEKEDERKEKHLQPFDPGAAGDSPSPTALLEPVGAASALGPEPSLMALEAPPVEDKENLQKVPSQKIAPDPEFRLTGVARLLTSLTEELPAGSSMRKHALTRIASHIGAMWLMEDLNHFARTLQGVVLDRQRKKDLEPFQMEELQSRMKLAIPRPPPPPKTERAPRTFSAHRPDKEPEVVKTSEPGIEPTSVNYPKPPPAPVVKKAPFAKISANAKMLAKAPAKAALTKAPPAANAAPTPPPKPKEKDIAADQIWRLCARMQEDRPIVMNAEVHQERLALFFRDVFAVASKQVHWETAWAQIGIPEEQRPDTGRAVLRLLLGYLSESNSDSDRVADAIAHLSKSHRIKMRLVEECFADFGTKIEELLGDQPGALMVIPRVLVHWFPRPTGTGWGWSRVGWSWQEWWKSAERLLQNLPGSRAFDVIQVMLAQIQAQEGDKKIHALVDASGRKSWDPSWIEKVSTKLKALAGDIDDDELRRRLGAVELKESEQSKSESETESE